MIRFVTIAGDNVGVQQQRVQITDGGKLWQFPMPTLAPNTQYVAKVYFRNPSSQRVSSGSQISQLKVTKVMELEDGGLVEFRGNKLTATDALRMNAGDQELFSWYFKTGNDMADYRTKYNNLKLEKMMIGGSEVSIHQSQQINLSNLDWSPNEATKTVSVFGPIEYHYSSNEPFNVLDVDDYQRSSVFPQATTEGLSDTANRIMWTNMLERSGIDSYDYVINESVRKQMMADFSQAAFGAGKKLEAGITTMPWNPITGGIGKRGSVRYDNLTQLMATRLWEVDYSKNTFGEPSSAGNEPSGASNPQVSSNSLSSTPSQLLVNAVLNKTTNVSIYLSPVNKKYDYIYKEGAYVQSGQGAVNVGNGMMVTVKSQVASLPSGSVTV